MALLDDVAKVLINTQDLQERIAELSAEINSAYTDEDRPLLICILKGAFMFLADLTRHLVIRHEIDFMEVSSYGTGRTSRDGTC